MVKLAEAANTAAMALLTISTLNAVTGGGMGKAGQFLMGAGAGLGGSRSKGFFGNLGRGGKNQRAQIRDYGKFRKMGLGPQAAMKGSQAGVAAKRLGALGTIGFGAFQAGSAFFDKDLEQSQKTERYKSAGGGTAGALIGGAIGSVVPVVGTIIGGAIGGYLGSKFGDVEGADRDVKLRRQTSFRQAREAGVLDFDVTTFNEEVSKNLELVRQSDGFAASLALEQNYNKALEAKARIIDRTARGEEVSDKEREVAQHNLNQAAMRLAGVRFLTSEREMQNQKDIIATNEKLGKANFNLAKAREDLAKQAVDVFNRAKKEQTQGKLRTSLSSSVTGPFAGAVNLAAEQNLMFRDINVAKEEKTRAQAALDSAIKSGASEDDLDSLRDNLEQAGDKFEASVNKAAVSFINKMTALEKGIADIDKQKSQLRAKGSSEASEKLY